jgi:hypothetical protein
MLHHKSKYFLKCTKKCKGVAQSCFQANKKNSIMNSKSKGYWMTPFLNIEMETYWMTLLFLILRSINIGST